jgi:hypothetical protein
MRLAALLAIPAAMANQKARFYECAKIYCTELESSKSGQPTSETYRKHWNVSTGEPLDDFKRQLFFAAAVQLYSSARIKE